MKRLTQSITLMGTVIDISADERRFKIRCHTGDEYNISVGSETQYRFLQNLDEINRDRIPNPEGFLGNPSQLVKKYILQGRLVVVQGVYQENDDKSCVDARVISLLQSSDGEFLFEQTHWWLTQISRLADSWLGYLYPNKQSFEIDDFALYRTNLNIVGLPTDDNIQESATLSRLIYGFSSAYLLTGSERFLSAARAAVNYHRGTFRSLAADGKHCFWASGKRKTMNSYHLYMGSLNEDDRDTIPLYEQIYALAGLAQYYRITLDWEVLDDIKKTVRTFNDFFLDPQSEYGEKAYGDYFSHLDYATMRWDSDNLAHNHARKNWNSIGDHIPAYLTNLILALDPLPEIDHGHEELRKFLDTCTKILKTTSTIILEKFPDPDPNIPFVNERFFRDWKQDLTWRWQQDRAIVGHNLKIAWNLTRVANYYYSAAAQSDIEKEREAHQSHADKLMNLANKLGTSMIEAGVDLSRGGIFDAVERRPKNNMPIDFVWGNTKDFWQQEQAILAYLILHGCTQEGEKKKAEYLHLAQEMAAFWNMFFLDRDNKGVFFRVTDVGMPVIQGDYANKAGHSIAGYHAFELNYLAHIYISAYVKKESFCLYFKPNANSRQRSVNILPDFFKPNALRVKRISIDGSELQNVDPDNFQIVLGELQFQLGSEAEIIVEFEPLKEP